MRRRRALRRALSPLSRRKVLAALAVVAVVGASEALAGGLAAGNSGDGFASRVEARAGQRVTRYVSSDAPTYHVLAFRMGYYHGTGARLVWRSGTLAKHVQPACTVTSRVNMVSCDDWSPSLAVSITGAWVQGDYLLKLVGSANQQSYVPLTVWDPSLHAAYLLKSDVLTWQAWNPYGGYDYYEGIGSCPPAHHPLCSRARIVSFDRPYGYGEGAGDFLAIELPLVRLVEQHGLDVAYGTDLTLVEHPGFALESDRSCRSAMTNAGRCASAMPSPLRSRRG